MVITIILLDIIYQCIILRIHCKYSEYSFTYARFFFQIYPIAHSIPNTKQNDFWHSRFRFRARFFFFFNKHILSK